MDWKVRAIVSTLVFIVGELTVYKGNCASVVNVGNDMFTIQHEASGKCIRVEDGSIHLQNCSSSPATQWKWGSTHRLFHMGSSQCLGMNVTSKTLALFNCDSDALLSWRCSEGSIYTMYQMMLTFSGNTVTVKRESSDIWKRGGTSENICQQPYRVIHTTDGNSNGAPCEFPFLYNGSWHHDCLPSSSTPSLGWCSTTSNFDKDQKWGTCLKYVDGCGDLWKGPLNGRCYQLVSKAMAKWHEARDSCRSQGGDLLSVSSAAELSSFSKEELPEKLWIGLNHLDWEQGWQWADGSALSYIPWDLDVPVRSYLLSDSDCGVLNSRFHFESQACDSRLPYICEKKENGTQTESTGRVGYNETECDEGWIAGLGYCLKYINSSAFQAAAQQECRKNDANLASIHSLEDVELLTKFLPPDARSEMWIGLVSNGSSATFHWLDNSPVSFTNWDRFQPPVQPPNTSNCVFMSREHQMWQVSNCKTVRVFLCKKEGKVKEGQVDKKCPPGQGWWRHGKACYKVNTTQVDFKGSCELTITNRFEQLFINSLLKQYTFGSQPQYFWTGLQDIKGTGEYQWFSKDGPGDRVTYTNWRYLEPARYGGCAVLSTEMPLGQWEVKNCTLFKAGTICKVPVEGKELVAPEPNSTIPCPQGWVSVEGNSYCYKVFHEERVSRKRSWEEAERFCEALGAHLPSFTNVEEMKALHSVMRESVSTDRYFWVGLNRRNPNTENAWEWSDGRPVSMAVFPQEFHEDDEYDRDCAAFKSLKGTFRRLFFFLLHDIPPRPFYASTFHCDAQMEWVCQIPRGQDPKIPEWYNPGGYHYTSRFIDGQEFWFVSEPKLYYHEAEEYCSSNQSRLASPQNLLAIRHLHDFLAQHAGSQPTYWWADLDEPDSVLPWILSHAHHFNARFLGKCTSIGPDSIYPEYNIPCNTRLPFICETLNVTSAEKHPPEPHAPRKPCENSTMSFRDKCYTVFPPRNLTFQQASEFCYTHRGSMVTIADQVEQDFITTLLSGQQQSNLWIGLKLKPHETQWVDNSPVKYLNFNPLLQGQIRHIYINPFEEGRFELCAYMLNDVHSSLLATWDYTSCSDRQFVSICQHYTDKPEVPVVSDAQFEVDGHVFKLVRKQNLTWTEARELCREEGMDLASVANALVQAVLSVNVSRAGTPMWIGLFSEDEGEHYRWIDNSHTMFSRWSDEDHTGSCVYLNTDGFWKAMECAEELGGAVCHVPHEDTVENPETSTKCPHKSGGPNWIPFKNNCYSFQLAGSRWSEEEKKNGAQTCSKLIGEGEVLTIRDEEENAFIVQQLQPFKDLAQFVWLGMYRDPKDNQLKWLDGTNVQYSNWVSGRQNVTDTFMAGLTLSGKWELFRSRFIFSKFMQKTIVVCKISNDSKDEFRKKAVDVEPSANQTYRVIAQTLNWFQALEKCSQDGGHLASILGKKDNRNVGLIAKRDGFPLWIGLSNQNASGWPYEWSDGSVLKYKPEGFWGTDTEESCVYVEPSGTWKKTNCYTQLEGAICYSSPNPRYSQLSSSSSMKCPESEGLSEWVQFEDHCYAFNMTFYNYSVYTMEDAKELCARLDSSSQLLTIKSQEENDFVSKYMAENPLITSRVWLGLKMEGKNGKWMDGSAMSFSNFARQSEDGGLSGDGCAVMISSQGTWHATNCTSSRSRIVCKVPARSGSSPAALVFFLIVLLLLIAVVGFIVYKKNRARFSSTIRYQRNFDEDTTSMITATD
ncbi:lymphocyte antigen 75 [Chanos chanos]|uniref:Lymphocyte antigen 75 n=1 Tax=Chanos chanos TaxID=29144 RepID=A0A6J2V4N2_CHACN|nr:lymphocyte antigen 75-like [Chanos chanos]